MENREAYRVLRNRCNHLCRSEKREFFHKNLINVSPKKVWQTLRSVGIGSQKPSHSYGIDADVFAHHFSSIPITLSDDQKRATLESLYTTSLPSRPPFDFAPVQADDIKKALEDITSKAVGLDNIGTALIKPIVDGILPVLEHIYNFSFSNGVFPTLWKHAKIIPLPKKHDTNNVADFRPISILPTLSKIFEKIIHSQIISYMNTYNLFNPFQSGFRKEHSTTTALTKITCDISEAMDSKLLTVLVLLDFSKAFDTVDFDILIAKLRSMGFSCSSRSFFETYLRGRQSRVDLGDSISDWVQASVGVPQGSVLGPLLFSIYISSLMENIKCKYHLFADDLQVYLHTTVENFASCVLSINEDLAHLSQVASSWGLLLNPAKTQSIIIGTRMSLSKITPQGHEIFVNGSNIPYSRNVSNLGITIDETLSWDAQVASVHGRFYRTMHQLRLLKNFLPLVVRKSLFYSLLLPIIDYADVAYMGLTSQQLSKFDRLQNAGIRFVYGLRKFDHVSSFRRELKLLTIKQRRYWRLLLLGFKVMRAREPRYLCEGLRGLGGEFYNTRAHSNTTLRIPAHGTSIMSNNFSLRFSQLWNRVPPSITRSVTFSSFRIALKKYLLTNEL